MARFILSAVGTVGTVVPFVAIASALKVRGHSVALLTNSRHCDEFSDSGVDMIPLDTPEEYDQFIHDSPLLNDPRTVRTVFERYFIPKARSEYETISSLIRPGQTAIIANEAPGIACRVAAEAYRVPLVSVFTYPSHISGMALLDEIILTVFARQVNELRTSIGLPHAIDLRLWWKSPKKYLALWPEWFFPKNETWPARVEPVGFIWFERGDVEHPEQEAVMEWIRGQATPVLITGGTGVFAGAAFYDLACRACRALSLSAIVLVRHDQMSSAARPSTARTLVLKYVPNIQELFQAVKLIIHHGGMGSIGQAVNVGVPQLVLADGGDRPENGLLVQKAGLGQYLPRHSWSIDEVSRAIGVQLTDRTTHERCKQGAAKSSIERSLARACNAIETQLSRNAAARSCYVSVDPTIYFQDPKSVGIAESLARRCSSLPAERRAALLKLLQRSPEEG